ncbi:cytochrome P450 [Rhodocollybia butyracea]|uniref:Cytochrome P450 n=1 Tax=Rhodocollybia butyracea TaxID=206335 RepID=A0A9P5PNP4_9AGAR|nr:cytochrome P450 [Rhodocollybia butyracea]
MSYAAYSLARCPQTQKRLRDELLSPPNGYEDWQQSLKCLDKLPYLDAVCRETLRLYTPHSFPPPHWTDNDVVIPQRWINTDAMLWGPDAALFKPERWIQDSTHQYYSGGLPPAILESKHSGWSHLMTFSIGPRNCIAYRMAVAEFKTCLAVLVSRFEFVQHDLMEKVYGEVEIVDRPRVRGVEGYYMPCWVQAL